MALSDLTEEALDHFEGWRGFRPVRIGNGAADINGEAMDAIFHADSRGLGAAHQGWMDLTRIIDWLCEHWDQPEESIWETRGGRKDFTYGRFQCGVALDRMIRLAGRRGRPGNLGRWMAERDKIYRQIMARGWHPDRHTFTQHYGSDVLDASLLLMPLMGFVPPPTRCGCPRWRRWTASWSPTAWCTGIPQRLTGWAARARGHFLAVHFLLRGRPRTVGPGCTEAELVFQKMHTSACTLKTSASPANSSATSPRPSATWPASTPPSTSTTSSTTAPETWNQYWPESKAPRHPDPNSGAAVRPPAAQRAIAESTGATSRCMAAKQAPKSGQWLKERLEKSG